MSRKTGIEWTDATWNPIRGCSRVSEGCRNCYAERNANRFVGPGAPYEGLIQLDADGKGIGKWNGQVKFFEKRLMDPLHMGLVVAEYCQAHLEEFLSTGKPNAKGCTACTWRGQRIFVNSMSDLFHENVTDEMLDRIFAVMALCPQHTFQVLTKRPERMREYLSENNPRYSARKVFDAAEKIDPKKGYRFDVDIYWPLPNVWLGVSVENQKAAVDRIHHLLGTPAAVRFLSVEPMLGSVELDRWLAICKHWKSEDSLVEAPWSPPYPKHWYRPQGLVSTDWVQPFHWVICGGESGPGSRPMHPDWARSVRDQCVAAGVPFFFKQWGEWAEGSEADQRVMAGREGHILRFPFNGRDVTDSNYVQMHRVGKKAADDLLDGVQWHQFPGVC